MSAGFAYAKSRNAEHSMDHVVSAMTGSVRHMMGRPVEIMGYANVESVSVMKTGLGNPVSTRRNVHSPVKPVKTSAALPRVLFVLMQAPVTAAAACVTIPMGRA